MAGLTTFNAKVRSLVTVEPYAFQYEGIRFLFETSYCILGDEMGLGKTMQAIVASYLTGKKTLIVCPALARETWRIEIQNVLRPWVDIELFTNSTLKDPEPETEYVIISYNMLAQCEHLFSWAQVIIADECQKLKERTTTWTEVFHKFVYEYMPAKLMLLSGTPIKNGVQEWWSVLTLCSYSPAKDNGLSILKDFPDQDDWNREFCYVRMVRIGGGRRVPKYSGLRNKKKLKAYLKHKYIRRMAKDHLDLPPLLHKAIFVSYEDDPELLEAWNDFQAGSGTNSPVKAKSALLKTKFTIQYAKELKKSVEAPILVYTDHVEAAEKLGEGLDCYVIHGATPIKTRDVLVKRFENGELDYLVFTIGTGAAVYTLIRSRDIIMNDEAWVPGDNAQVYRRIVRIKQRFDCTIHHIMGSRQDEHISKQNRAKEKVLLEAM